MTHKQIQTPFRVDGSNLPLRAIGGRSSGGYHVAVFMYEGYDRPATQSIDHLVDYALSKGVGRHAISKRRLADLC